MRAASAPRVTLTLTVHEPPASPPPISAPHGWQDNAAYSPCSSVYGSPRASSTPSEGSVQDTPRAAEASAAPVVPQQPQQEAPKASAASPDQAATPGGGGGGLLSSVLLEVLPGFLRRRVSPAAAAAAPDQDTEGSPRDMLARARAAQLAAVAESSRSAPATPALSAPTPADPAAVPAQQSPAAAEKLVSVRLAVQEQPGQQHSSSTSGSWQQVSPASADSSAPAAAAEGELATPEKVAELVKQPSRWECSPQGADVEKVERVMEGYVEVTLHVRAPQLLMLPHAMPVCCASLLVCMRARHGAWPSMTRMLGSFLVLSVYLCGGHRR